ncbi:DHHC palmitoyltransferase-domain-containing protein [Tricladium varicosporioides]|nr:DHHC palmitoyltransferase-domain-containing protein [Hymenoscyphus varicosporioides]
MARIQKMADRNVTVNIWIARAMPVILMGIIGYATYVLVALLCVNYLLVRHGDKRAAIPILVLYFTIFTLMTISFVRLIYTTTFDPPYVPLGQVAIRERKEKGKIRSEEDGIGAGEYTSGGTKDDPDSPGLELFYTKDVFVCEPNGKPIWCSHCTNWKPDRAHHDSSSGRCIRKMDHFCPWVGGPVGENNFKFFIQFTSWTALYCLLVLIVMSIYVHRQVLSPSEALNGHFAAVLALAGLFFMFTASMAGGSIDLALKNLTTVERLGTRTKLYKLAVKKPVLEELVRISPYMAYNGTYAEITYPLGQDRADLGLGANAFPPTTQSPHTIIQVVPSELALSGEATTNPSTEIPENLNTSTGSPQASVPRAEKLSQRDQMATRTFAVLQMIDQGDNPWDLGSALKNWETVMGNRIVDWFLPSESPCSNHEDPESQFSLGPAVDKVKVAYYFIDAREGPANQQHHNSQKSSLSNGGMNTTTLNGRSVHRKWQPFRKAYQLNKHSASSQSDNQIKLEQMNGYATTPLAQPA